MTLSRPLLLEGEPGAGKTELAKALARWTGGQLIRLQCYEGVDVSQAVYEWDHARQLLHLRTAETAGALADRTHAGEGSGAPDHRGEVGAVLEDELYSERFLVRRPLLQAIDHAGNGPVPVLLVDEVDRADDEFEALLLEVLADNAVTVPELGTFRAARPPVVVLTSNRTRDVHDALRRRCLYHWVEHPDREREVAIVRLRAPEASAKLARQVAALVGELRAMGLYKPPGVAETIDWTQALTRLGHDRLTPEAATATLGAAVKYREDQERVRAAGLAPLVAGALSAADPPASGGSDA